MRQCRKSWISCRREYVKKVGKRLTKSYTQVKLPPPAQHIVYRVSRIPLDRLMSEANKSNRAQLSRKLKAELKTFKICSPKKSTSLKDNWPNKSTKINSSIKNPPFSPKKLKRKNSDLTTCSTNSKSNLKKKSIKKSLKPLDIKSDKKLSITMIISISKPVRIHSKKKKTKPMKELKSSMKISQKKQTKSKSKRPSILFNPKSSKSYFLLLVAMIKIDKVQ